MYVDPRKYMNIFLTAWLLIMTGRLVLCTLWAQALACFLKVGRSSWLFLEDWRAFSYRVGFVHPRKICLDFILTPKCAISFKTSAEINPYFLNLSSGYMIFCILPASAFLFTLVSSNGGKASTTGNQTGSHAFLIAPERRRLRTLKSK